MPYRDPHTAAPCLWAIRQEDGPAFSVSYTSPPNVSMDRKRKGLEAALIAIYRKEIGESPTANFGRIIPGYRQSSSRRGGRVGGPLSDDQVEPNTERGVEPLSWAHYQDLAHSRWMGLHWTEWQSIPEAQAEASTDNGLYRIKTTTDEILTYIGQSGNLRSRLRAHTKTYSEDHRIQFAVRPELGARHKREETETELIGAHYLLTDEPPRNQF